MCEANAIVSFGVTKAAAQRYKQAKRTYYAYGHRETLLVFCDQHFEEAALTWPGLATNPVQPVNRYKQAGVTAIERLRGKLQEPATRERVLMLWREAAIEDRRSSRAVGSRRRNRAGEEHTIRLLEQMRDLLAKS
ncbi:MAG: hypothetical protein HYR63_03670 [Proteobacteria bacterium]|nr:hypothetical protein [Pseudomonadota bacterium]MBI3498559.1 hypothetical protein [Pseudomonadota bacterium]